ncbi:MAG: YciI family protein [Planctomycetota bacterium]
MEQFLYLLKPTRLGMLTEGPSDEESVALGRHVDYLARLVDEGTAILFGRTQTADESTFGLVIFEAEDEPAARRVMEADPCVEEGVMTAQLFPYRVAGMRR